MYKFHVFFRFWVKFLGLSHFSSKFHTFSRPVKVYDKIQGFAGRVDAMYKGVHTSHIAGLLTLMDYSGDQCEVTA